MNLSLWPRVLPMKPRPASWATKCCSPSGRLFRWRGKSLAVGITVGFALAPLDGRDAVSLLKRADAAMYAGKQDGRHCVRRGTASAALANC